MRRSSAEASRLLVWFSPGFPTGAFGFSHGLEWAVEAGDVFDRETLSRWIGGVLDHGGAWSDAVIAAAAYRAVEARDADGLREIMAFALALPPSRERRLETIVQGDAFARAVETGWPNAGIAFLRKEADGPIPLPVAIGAAAAGDALDLESTLAACLTGFSANLVSAAIRLAPIGQSDGLRVVADLEPAIARLATRAALSTIDDVGTCAFRSDIAAMRHETQTTRLFRS
jgi:urease accessory protein